MADPGLHSKFIEMQQEESQQAASIAGRFIDAAERERHESLRLSRSRLLEQLSRATQPRYRQQLKRALRDVESSLRRA